MWCGALSEIDIPASVEEIGEYCFGGCNIQKLSISSENRFFRVVDSLVISNDGKLAVSCFRAVRKLEIPATVASATLFFRRLLLRRGVH